MVNVAPGEQFEMVLEHQVNNETGQLNYAAGTLNGGISLPVTLQSVTLEAKTQFSSSALDSIGSPTHMSEIAYQGHSIYSGIILTE